MIRAKASIVKARNFEPRPRMWIRRRVIALEHTSPFLSRRKFSFIAERSDALLHCRKIIERMIQEEALKKRFEVHILLYWVTYTFLLRLPSEALPLTLGKGSSPFAIYLEDQRLVVSLNSRCVRRSCHVWSIPVGRAGKTNQQVAF